MTRVDLSTFVQKIRIESLAKWLVPTLESWIKEQYLLKFWNSSHYLTDNSYDPYAYTYPLITDDDGTKKKKRKKTKKKKYHGPRPYDKGEKTDQNDQHFVVG